MNTCPNCGEQISEAGANSHFDFTTSMYWCVPNGGGWGSELLSQMEEEHRKHRLLMREVGKGASDEALEEMMLALRHLGNAIAAVRRRSTTATESNGEENGRTESLESTIQNLPVEALRHNYRQSLEDWAATDAAIRKAARTIMTETEVEGDSHGVPPLEDIVTALVSRVTVLERGLTHPQIHVDYYAWLKSLSDFDRNFMAEASPNGIAMWAWTRGREILRAEARKPADGVTSPDEPSTHSAGVETQQKEPHPEDGAINRRPEAGAS